MYLFFCFAQDAKGKRLPRPGPGALQCAVKKGIKCQQNCLDGSGSRTPVDRATCARVYHWANSGSDTSWNFGVLIPWNQIHTHTDNTYIYVHIHTIHAIHAHTGTYMHAPITVGRGLWGAVADAVCLRGRRNFPNRLGWGLGPGWQARIWPGTPCSRAGGAVQGPPTGGEGGGARNRVVGVDRDGGKECLGTWPGLPWVRPAGCRRRRRSLGDAAVIFVPAAAIEANTTFIHTIQTDTYDTYTYTQYRHIHTLTNLQKMICNDLGEAIP